jgi:hypothetical protein
MCPFFATSGAKLSKKGCPAVLSKETCPFTPNMKNCPKFKNIGTCTYLKKVCPFFQKGTCDFLSKVHKEPKSFTTKIQTFTTKVPAN